MNDIITLLNLLLRPARAGGTGLLDSYQKTFAETIIGRASVPTLSFWRGRVALWTILRAAGIEEDDEVILPAYTCEMVPVAVKFAGGKCVYVDAEPDRYNASVESIVQAVTAQTKAIICQHTYGIHSQVGKLASLLAGKDIIIEDCCQLIQGNWDRRGPTDLSSAAFFSTQWNKPFSTGLGGMAVFFDDELYSASQGILADFSHNSNQLQALSLITQMLLYNLTVRPKTKAFIANLYRFAQRTGLVRGTTSPKEFGREMPSDYLAGAINVQAVMGMKQLQQWKQNVKHRRMLTKFYLEHLVKLGIDVTALTVNDAEPALWAIPLFVENVNEVLKFAGRAGLPIATWFGQPPIHLVSDMAERFDYTIGQCPRSEWLVHHEIHLSTSPIVTLKQAKRTINFIEQRVHLVGR